MSSKLLQLSLYVVTVIQLTSAETTTDSTQLTTTVSQLQQNDVSTSSPTDQLLNRLNQLVITASELQTSMSQLQTSMSQLQMTVSLLQSSNSQLQINIATVVDIVIASPILGTVFASIYPLNPLI